MERFYRFAGVTFRVTGREEEMYHEEDVLASYRTEGPAADHHMEMEIVHSLPDPEGTCVFSDARKRVYQNGDTQLYCVGEHRNVYMHVRRQGANTRVQILRRAVPERIMPRLVLNAMEAEHHIVRHGGFLLHASYIGLNGKAILFTAPSGTGKSTQAELWRRLRGAELINGDRAAVMVGQEGVMACGIPFCGTSGVSKNVTLPVEAIVCLSQAPRSAASALKGLRAFRYVWEGCSVNVWNKEDVERCTQAVMSAVQQVPVISLACTPDGSAVAALEEVLKELR